MMRTATIIGPAALALALLPATVGAQTSGGSSYSVLNLGDLQTSTSVAGQGRGGVETAVPLGLVFNSVNPAGWSSMRSVTLQASMNFDQYKVSDAQRSLYQNNTSIQGFSVAFPFSEEYGITAGLGFRPYTTVNYRTQLSQRVQTGTDSATALTTFHGDGGLSEALLGTSFKPASWLSLGAALEWYFGSIQRRTIVTFPESSLNPATYFRNEHFQGLGGRFGLQIEPTPNLYLGAVFQTATELDRTHYLINNYVDAGRDVVDTTERGVTAVTIPPKLSFGASYRAGRSLVAVDAAMQAWEKDEFSTARSAARYGIGYEYLASESMNAAGWERWTFRLGGFFENTYYSLPGGDIDQMGVTLGFGVPLTSFNRLNANTAIDVAFQLGTRGTTENGLTKEMFGKLSLEIAISELWFSKLRK